MQMFECFVDGFNIWKIDYSICLTRFFRNHLKHHASRVLALRDSRTTIFFRRFQETLSNEKMSPESSFHFLDQLIYVGHASDTSMALRVLKKLLYNFEVRCNILENIFRNTNIRDFSHSTAQNMTEAPHSFLIQRRDLPADRAPRHARQDCCSIRSKREDF